MAEKQEERTPDHDDFVGDGTTIPDSQESHDAWEPRTDHEVKATSGGWKPEHEFEGDPEDFVTAPEFNRRGELMGRITQLGRKLGDSEKLIEKLTAMVNANETVTQRMINEQVAATEKRLKNQRREAMHEGDFERADQVDEALDELKTTQAEVKAAAEPKAPEPTQAAPQPDVAKMTPQQRTWYDFMTTTKWAQVEEVHNPLLRHAETYLTDNPEAGTGEFLSELMEKGNELRGVKPKAPKPPGGPDDGKGTPRTPKQPRQVKGKYTRADLNPQQTSIAREFIDDGIIKSLDEYATMMGNEGHLDGQRG